MLAFILVAWMMCMIIVPYILVHLSMLWISQLLHNQWPKAKSGKASDAQHMKAELVKAAPKESATSWLPLVWSTLATRQEPASFDGGIAYPLSKGKKGDGSYRPTGYREILLSCII
eukprot:10019421-Karenia_brevis.AAC.1